jgi:hypothetical protein
VCCSSDGFAARGLYARTCSLLQLLVLQSTASAAEHCMAIWIGSPAFVLYDPTRPANKARNCHDILMLLLCATRLYATREMRPAATCRVCLPWHLQGQWRLQPSLTYLQAPPPPWCVTSSVQPQTCR